jgi:hypothetical protein
VNDTRAVQPRIRTGLLWLTVLLAVLIGLASLAGLILAATVGGVGGRNIAAGVIGLAVAAAAGAMAVHGHRRRRWPWVLAALGTELAWAAVASVGFA